MTKSDIAPVGSKVSVFHGNALRTPGGLTKSDLMRNKRGKIVSRKKHAQAMRSSNLPELLRKS